MPPWDCGDEFIVRHRKLARRGQGLKLTCSESEVI
jgi:hypothetical protein